MKGHWTGRMTLYLWMRQRDSISIISQRSQDFSLEGGVLVSDNVLQDGDVIESRLCVERRNRTIHSRMREYLFELKHSDML